MTSNPNIREPRPKQHQNMHHAHCVLLFGSTKECSSESETSFNMNDLGSMLCTTCQAIKDKPSVLVLHERCRIGKSVKSDSGREVFRSWGRPGCHCLKDLCFLFVMM